MQSTMVQFTTVLSTVHDRVVKNDDNCKEEAQCASFDAVHSRVVKSYETGKGEAADDDEKLEEADHSAYG